MFQTGKNSNKSVDYIPAKAIDLWLLTLPPLPAYPKVSRADNTLVMNHQSARKNAKRRSHPHAGLEMCLLPSKRKPWNFHHNSAIVSLPEVEIRSFSPFTNLIPAMLKLFLDSTLITKYSNCVCPFRMWCHRTVLWYFPRPPAHIVKWPKTSSTKLAQPTKWSNWMSTMMGGVCKRP